MSQGIMRHDQPQNERAITLLADRLARLTVSHRDPEAFHLEKAEIVGELRRLADEIRARRDGNGSRCVGRSASAKSRHHRDDEAAR